MKACDTTFSILDSRNTWARGFHCAITPNNVTEIFEMMDSLEKYFKSLMLSNKTYLVYSRNHTAYSSALMGFFNAKTLYYDLVTGGILSSLKMHVLSQDEVEHFIGDQRCRNFGNNNNPHAEDLASSYRSLQSLNEIAFTRDGGNCFIHKGEESMKMIPTTSSTSLGARKLVKNLPFNVDESLKKTVKSKKPVLRANKSKVTFDAESIETVTKTAVCYIAGYVQRRIIENLDCELCKISIEDEDYRTTSKFIDSREFVEYGGLVYPHSHIVDICRKAQNHFELEAQRMTTNLPEIVALKVQRDLLDSNMFIDLIDHPRGVDRIEDHCHKLIQSICNFFIRAKSRHFAKRFNLNIHEKRVRHQLSHTIKFQGQ